MECPFHAGNNAITTCVQCETPICPLCASETNQVHLCLNCYRSKVEELSAELGSASLRLAKERRKAEARVSLGKKRRAKEEPPPAPVARPAFEMGAAESLWEKEDVAPIAPGEEATTATTEARPTPVEAPPAPPQFTPPLVPPAPPGEAPLETFIPAAPAEAPLSKKELARLQKEEAKRRREEEKAARKAAKAAPGEAVPPSMPEPAPFFEERPEPGVQAAPQPAAPAQPYAQEGPALRPEPVKPVPPLEIPPLDLPTEPPPGGVKIPRLEDRLEPLPPLEPGEPGMPPDLEPPEGFFD